MLEAHAPIDEGQEDGGSSDKKKGQQEDVLEGVFARPSALEGMVGK